MARYVHMQKHTSNDHHSNESKGPDIPAQGFLVLIPNADQPYAEDGSGRQKATTICEKTQHKRPPSRKPPPREGNMLPCEMNANQSAKHGEVKLGLKTPKGILP